MRVPLVALARLPGGQNDACVAALRYHLVHVG
jgi:hypothetical protein